VSKFIQYINYIIAYIALIVLWLCIILATLRLFHIIEMEGKLLIVIIISGTLYYKLKPMTFKELFDNYDRNKK
jgi:hypothetical protein